MNSASALALRLGAGLAVGFWGLSKLFFVSNWVGPYEYFYGNAFAQILVYVLGIIQIAIAAMIIADFYRKPAAWVAVVFSVVNLVVSLAGIFRPENPILANPAPIGIKLLWFFGNPIALTLVFIALALAPKLEGTPRSEHDLKQDPTP